MFYKQLKQVSTYLAITVVIVRSKDSFKTLNINWKNKHYVNVTKLVQNNKLMLNNLLAKVRIEQKPEST